MHITYASCITLLILLLSSHTAIASTNSVLRIGVLGKIDNIHPMMAKTEAANYLNFFIQRPMQSLDKNWQWQCLICTKIPTQENGRIQLIGDESKKKTLKVTWKIKQQANWGDGSPITGYDFLFTWRLGRSPFTQTSTPSLFTAIKSIEVDSAEPKIFTITYKKTHYSHTHLGFFPIVPRHTEKKRWNQVLNNNATYSNVTAYQKDPTNPSLYSGPYLIKSIENLGAEEQYTLTENPHYYGQKAKIKTIVITIKKDISDLTAMLFSGEIDMISEAGQDMNATYQLRELLKEKPTPQLLSHYEETSVIFEHIIFNLRNPILKDHQVRKALFLSVDRNKILTKILKNKAILADGHTHPSDPMHPTKAEKNDPYNLSLAKKLLEQSGWKIKEGEKTRVKDGDKLHLEISTLKSNELRNKIIDHITEQWESLGISIKKYQIPKQYFYSKTLKQIRYTGMAFFASEQPADTPPTAMLDTREIPTLRNKYQGQNSGAWINKKVSKTFDKLKTSLSTEKRRKMMETIQQQTDKDLPTIPLFYATRLLIHPPTLKNVGFAGHQYPSSLNSEFWEWKKN